MVRRIWNIQVEHLDEAEFLLEMWHNCIDSPKYDLAKIHDGPEERFLARIAGLVIGGQPTVDRLLLPVLDSPDDDEFRTAAAACAVLEGAGLDACERVLAAFDACEDDEGEDGLVRALSLSRRAGLVPWLGRGLENVNGRGLRGRLRVLDHHRVDVGVHLLGWLGADELELRTIAARLARHTSHSEILAQLGSASTSEDEQLRGAALESALIRGMSGAWEWIGHEAFVHRTPALQRAALTWVAGLGDPGVHRLLLAAMQTPTPELIWAAGISGRVEAVDLAVELLEHEQLARLAGEVVCTIAGLSAKHDDYWLDNGSVPVGDDPDEALPALADDNLEAKLVPLGEASLRLPNATSIRAWWSKRRSEFTGGLRYSRGQPLDGARLQRDLLELPTRVRHARALELAARTNGRAQLETRALARTQLAQLDALSSHFTGLDCQRGRPLA